MGDFGVAGRNTWQLGLHGNAVAQFELAKARCGHHQIHTQWVQCGQTQHRAVFHPFTGVAETLGDDAVKRRPDGALLDLRPHHIQVGGQHLALAFALGHALHRHLLFGARLLDRLRRHKAFAEQVVGAGVALVGELQTGLRAAYVGVNAPAGFGRPFTGRFDLAAQHHQGLALAHRIADVDIDLPNNAGDRRADVGHTLRADQATQRGGGRFGQTRCGRREAALNGGDGVGFGRGCGCGCGRSRA